MFNVDEMFDVYIEEIGQYVPNLARGEVDEQAARDGMLVLLGQYACWVHVLLKRQGLDPAMYTDEGDWINLWDRLGIGGCDAADAIAAATSKLPA